MQLSRLTAAERKSTAKTTAARLRAMWARAGRTKDDSQGEMQFHADRARNKGFEGEHSRKLAAIHARVLIDMAAVQQRLEAAIAALGTVPHCPECGSDELEQTGRIAADPDCGIREQPAGVYCCGCGECVEDTRPDEDVARLGGAL
jgi:hypothetical protein